MDSIQLISIFRKIYNKGALWTFLRVRREFRQPSFRSVLDAMVAFKKINRRLKAILFKEKEGAADYVTAVYDLNVNPITYDFAYFLAAAELFALKNKKSAFVVLFVSQRDDHIVNEVSRQYRSTVDEESMKWRFENIILPLMSIYPACIGHSILPKGSDTSEAIKGKFLYPEFYSERFHTADYYFEVFASKNKFFGFSASIQGKRYIESWKKLNKITGKIVTITLRQYNWDPTRNSKVDEWVKFAQFIRGKGFTPVFIPDTDVCFEHDPRLDGFIVFEAPCWNLGIRTALYEEVDLNFFSPNGPAAIAILNRNAASITMKILVPGSMTASVEGVTKMGISIGQKTFYFSEDHFQVLSWEDDTFENIREEFSRFLAEKPYTQYLSEASIK
jgi:hypothetical protein